MEQDDLDAAPRGAAAPRSAINRRRVIGLGAAAGAAAWVAPAILSADAAAAASGQPTPCTCGQSVPEIVLTVVLLPCVPVATTVTVTGTQSGTRSQVLGPTSIGNPGVVTFPVFCDGETVTVSLAGAACGPNPQTIVVSCQQTTPQVIFSCGPC